MIRLVSIPNAFLDRDDLAMWLIFPPVSLGIGYSFRLVVSSTRIEPIFESSLRAPSLLEGVHSISPFLEGKLKLN